MNKLVYGVGVNDLGYRVHVQEYVTKDGGKKGRNTVFKCKYYTVWTLHTSVLPIQQVRRI